MDVGRSVTQIKRHRTNFPIQGEGYSRQDKRDPSPHTLDQKLSEGSQYSIESNAVNKIWPIWEIGVSTVAVGATRQQFNSVQQEGEICDGAIS